MDSANAYTNIQLSDVQVSPASVPDGFAFDNVTVGGVNPAPEPGAFALMGLGMAGLLGLRHVKRNRVPTN